MSGTGSPPLPPILPEAAAAPLTPEQRKAYAEIGAALEAGDRTWPSMKKYSFDWFIAQSRAAQQNASSWPASMKINMTTTASATLPILGDPKKEQPK